MRRAPCTASPALAVLSFCLLLGSSRPAAAASPAVERARSAVASGLAVPERDLQPLLTELQRSRDVDERRELVEAISDLGARDAQSSNIVKSWLLEHATPVLLDVAKNGHDAFLQGDAVTALREMGAPRATLEQAAAIAEADPDSYVQSRGEILRNYIKGMPAEDPAAAKPHPKDAAAAREGVLYLDKRGIAASPQSLREAAGRADADSVKALLAAGVPADAGSTDLGETPLGKALEQGCIQQAADTDWLVETVQMLVKAGADVRRLDDNRNTPLMLAVHWCGARMVGVLAGAGGDLSHRNGSGLSAFGLALATGKLDSAEVLVKKGARVGAEEKKMLVSSATSARARDLLARASKPR